MRSELSQGSRDLSAHCHQGSRLSARSGGPLFRVRQPDASDRSPQTGSRVVELAIETFDRLQSIGRFDKNTQGAYIKAWCTEGDIDEALGDFQQAWTEFSRCSELAKAHAVQYPETASIYLASQAAERKATTAQELGNLSGALQALDEDESSLRGLLEREPRNPRLLG